ncbi:hypothetical protein OIU34_20245 [Pararhizobium sp. BT-229]|uniref:hypothetical protein n=1 Tax=Pararhizobium sp. BT-229 TaxID=2986923 RepID=UPI0021F6F23C|nr:hypothetical protein [Pararhizobium sp. BT-229]MCV9964219.1 hypothetical protein [Pararhizobium sp. BT-229]
MILDGRQSSAVSPPSSIALRNVGSTTVRGEDEAALYEHPKKRADMQHFFAALKAGDRPRVRIVSRYDDQSAEEAGLYYIPVGSILAVEAS